MIACESRVLIFDTKHEHAGRVCTLRALHRAVADGQAGRLVLRPSFDDARRKAEFEVFCALAWLAAPVCVLVEELWAVTGPGWAPGPWRRLTLAGRARGVRIIATAQRPAGMDKDFLSQCTLVRSFALPHGPDADTVARRLGVPAERLADLPPLHFLERRDGGPVTAGTVRP